MTAILTHKELEKTIDEFLLVEKDKPSIMVRGYRGVGKSVTIQNKAKQRAKNINKEYVNFGQITQKKKREVLENPNKYFCLIDIRLSEYDSSDIKGLPKFTDDSRGIEYKIPLWALLLEHKDSEGFLFFDEMNLTTPLVMSSCYKIINDREINDGKINDKWLILAGGNLSEERAYTHEIPKPLCDRFSEIRLESPSIDGFTDYASKHGIDSRIISFLNFKSSALFSISEDDDAQKDTTPRGWERVSKLIKGKEDLNIISLLTRISIGEGIANEFISFCRIKDKIDLDDLIKNPSKIEKLEDVSLKYFFISGVSDKYQNDKIDFKKIVEISKVFDKINNAEFVALLWRICYNSNEKFKDEFIKNMDLTLTDKYAKYLV